MFSPVRRRDDEGDSEVANSDVVIPIVFPDYRIGVNTPPLDVSIPDIVPVFDLTPTHIKLPATKQNIPYLGHAGVLLINGKTGLTRYFEYGRYDRAERGLVRKQNVIDVRIGQNGRPTMQTLRELLGQISVKSGRGGSIKAAYIEMDSGAFSRMDNYALGRMKSNNDPKRSPYELLNNSCLHFMKSVAEAGGASMPLVIAPHPTGYIIQVRLQKNELDFDRSGIMTVEDITLP